MDDLAILNRPPRLPSIERVELTPDQMLKWEHTRTALMWKCPAFTHILITLLDNAGSKHIAIFTKSIPTAATDGSVLLYNPDWFFKLPLAQRVFVTAHEIMHGIFNHMILGFALSQRGEVPYADGKKLKYNHKQMNIAMDLVINDILVEGKIGVMPPEGWHDPATVTGNDSFLEAYRKIYTEDDSGGGGGGGFDEHAEPGSGTGKSPTQAKAERDDGEWQAQVAAAMHAARVQGKLPAGLEKILNEVMEPKVEWRDHIQALFARRVGAGSYDWRRPDRQLLAQDIYAPSRSGFGAECVVVAADSSGSVFGEIDMWMAELSGILEEVRPKRLILLWCDAKVQRVDDCNDAGDLNTIRHKGAVGGGGTSFRPVFEWIEKEGITPDALVYLTDGEGSFPDRAPNYPVIWGNILESSKYPFGDVVFVPKQAK